MKINKCFLHLVCVLFSSLLHAQNYVKIGDLYWSQNNLNVSEFKNGDPIYEAKSSDDWENYFKQGLPAFCSLDYNAKNDSIHGKIYNWFAVVDPRGLAPEGFKVPSIEDWMRLRTRLNYDTICKCIPPILSSANKLKSSVEWKSEVKGQNMFNMNILPSGYLKNDGLHDGRFRQVSYWTSSSHNSAQVIGDSFTALYVIFNNQNSDITYDKNFEANGHFVRCATGQQEYFFSPTNSYQKLIEGSPEDSNSEDESDN